jgi:hypothetical protein
VLSCKRDEDGPGGELGPTTGACAPRITVAGFLWRIRVRSLRDRPGLVRLGHWMPHAEPSPVTPLVLAAYNELLLLFLCPPPGSMYQSGMMTGTSEAALRKEEAEASSL